jgi:plasmid stabilization system protein ParE
VDYRLLFTQRALSDLSEIVEHIAQDDDEAASRFGEALLDHVDLLGRFPRMGNPQKVAGA